MLIISEGGDRKIYILLLVSVVGYSELATRYSVCPEETCLLLGVDEHFMVLLLFHVL